MADKDVQYEKAPMGKPLGTAFDALDSLWGPDYDSNDVFDYGAWEARDMAEMLDRDGKAKTVEQVLTLPIRHAPVMIEPGKGDKGEAELIEKILTTPANAGGMSTPLNHVIGQATSAFMYRKAFFEKVFRQGTGDLAGKIVLDELGWRPPSTCQLARDAKHGKFRGFRQQPYNVGSLKSSVFAKDWIRIPTDRAWVYIHGQHRAPLRGYSDLEVALWAYRTKQKLRYLWYIFLEGQAVPKSIVRNKDFSRAKQEAMRVRSLKGGGTLALGEGTTIDPYESSGKGAAEFINAIKFLDSEMAGSVLAGFTDLTSAASDGRGSFALSKDQSDFFLQSREAVAEELATSVNHFVVADLVKYNFGQDAVMPEFKFGQLADADIADALTLLGSLAVATSNNLPDEFVYMLSEKASDYLDLDTDKLRKSIEEHAKEKEEQAKAMAQQMNNPAMAAAVQKGSVKPEVAKHMAANAGQVGRATGAADKVTSLVQRRQAGAKLSEYSNDRTIIDTGRGTWELAEEPDEAIVLAADDGTLIDVEDGSVVELAAIDGHHVPGTAYHWRHNWHALNVATAIKYRKGKKAIAALQAKGKHSGIEPEWYQELNPGSKFTKKVGGSHGAPETKVKLTGVKDLKPGMVIGDKKWKLDKVEPHKAGKTKLHVTTQQGGKSSFIVGEKSKIPVHHQVSKLSIGSNPNTPHTGDEGGTSMPFASKAEKSVPAKKKLAEWEKAYKPPKVPEKEAPNVSEQFAAKGMKKTPTLAEQQQAEWGKTLQKKKGWISLPKESATAADKIAQAKANVKGKTHYSYKKDGKFYGGEYVPEGATDVVHHDPKGWAEKKNAPEPPKKSVGGPGFATAAIAAKVAQEDANKLGKPHYVEKKGSAFYVHDTDPGPGHAYVTHEPEPKSTIKAYGSAKDAIQHAQEQAKSEGKDVHAWKSGANFYTGTDKAEIPNKPSGDPVKPNTFHPDGTYTAPDGSLHKPLTQDQAENLVGKVLPPNDQYGGHKTYKTSKGAVKGALNESKKYKSVQHVTYDPHSVVTNGPAYKLHHSKPQGDHLKVYPSGEMEHVKAAPKGEEPKDWIGKKKDLPSGVISSHKSKSTAETYAQNFADAQGKTHYVHKNTDSGEYEVTDTPVGVYTKHAPAEKSSESSTVQQFQKMSDAHHQALEMGKTKPAYLWKDGATDTWNVSYGPPSEEAVEYHGKEVKKYFPKISTPQKTELPEPPVTGKDGTSKLDAIAEAKKSSTFGNPKFVYYNPETGNWVIGSKADAEKIGQAGQISVVKSDGTVQKFDPSYDTKAGAGYGAYGYKHAWTGDPVPKVEGFGKGLATGAKTHNDIAEKYKKEIGTVPQTEFQAMKDYTLSGYSDINDPLRDGTPLSPSAKARMKRLDTLAARWSAPEDLYVRRGISSGKFPNTFYEKGAVFEDKAFGSTSFEQPFQRDIMMEIIVPKGTHGIPTRGLGGGSMGANSHESELILPRGTHYQVISDYADASGVRRMQLMVVTDEVTA